MAAESLELSPQSASQQSVVIGKVNQRVVVQLVTGKAVSHSDALLNRTDTGDMTATVS